MSVDVQHLPLQRLNGLVHFWDTTGLLRANSNFINHFVLIRCPIDREIMPGFEYSDGLSKATSTFLAHKFPYTKSVYYQCHVRLCHKPSGGCDDVVRFRYTNTFAVIYSDIERIWLLLNPLTDLVFTATFLRWACDEQAGQRSRASIIKQNYSRC